MLKPPVHLLAQLPYDAMHPINFLCFMGILLKPHEFWEIYRMHARLR